MKILQLHADYIEYEPIRKEIDTAEEAEQKPYRFDDIVVLFTAVEEQDNENTVFQAVASTKDSLRNLGANKVLIYPYAHLSSNLAPPTTALKLIKTMVEEFRRLGLEVSQAPFGWNKAFTIKVKGHPLAEQSRSIQAAVSAGEAVSQALKAEEKLVSRWYIIDLDGTLVPAESFDFTKYRRLKELTDYEVAKSRVVQQEPPHVELMVRLGLVGYEPGSDAGNLRFYPKGRLVKALLERYVTQMVREYGGVEVETPIMYDMRHPALSDYLNRFPARQYVVRSEDKELFLRFSACFGQFLMAKDTQISYKHLPFRLYELTRYSFRREKSGELVGLRRLRAFTMPDCHAFCKDLEQAKSEVLRRFELSMTVLSGIGLTKDDYELAIRATEDFYKENKEFFVELVRRLGKPALLEMWSERFFYFVFKWEFNFIDNLSKASALSTDQIDVENAKRYGIQYMDEDGAMKYPLILHNSPSGAIERCMYALLEKAYRVAQSGGTPTLPVWLSPTQVRLIPTSSSYVEGACALAAKMNESCVRCDVDDREETVQKRVREAEKEWVPYIVVYGEKEASSNTLQVRDRMNRTIRQMGLDDLIKIVHEQTANKPYLPLPLPTLLSQRPRFT
ncbi:MAG: threonine--tRNA ligase [Thaumarchaeota archaeon]|nr:threonine--tRNA ligase [Nitrososphaerota archaeon]